MTVTAPPKPPNVDDLRKRSAESLGEQALIEEARLRARKRRQRYATVALLGAVVAVAIVVGFGRAAGRPAGGSGGSSGGLPAGAAAGNGKIAFAVGLGALYLVNPDGSGLHAAASCHVTPAGCGILEPAWSPDGKQLAFVRGRLGWPTPVAPIAPRNRLFLYVEDADGGAVRRLASCGSCAEQWRGHLSWSPDSSQIAFSRDSGSGGQESLWVVDTVSGKLRRLTDCLPPACGDVSPAWSPDGQLIVFDRIASQDSGLYTLRPNGSQLTRIATGTDPQWSPGGHKIAFDSGDNIFVADANGSHRTLLLAGSGSGSGPGVPSWSPDGTKLAFLYTPGRPGAFTAELWTTNRDGSAKRRLYHSACCVGSWAAPIWSPDGTKIAFAADAAYGTYVINSDGSDLHPLSGVSAVGITWQRIP